MRYQKLVSLVAIGLTVLGCREDPSILAAQLRSEKQKTAQLELYIEQMQSVLARSLNFGERCLSTLQRLEITDQFQPPPTRLPQKGG